MRRKYMYRDRKKWSNTVDEREIFTPYKSRELIYKSNV